MKNKIWKLIDQYILIILVFLFGYSAGRIVTFLKFKEQASSILNENYQVSDLLPIVQLLQFNNGVLKGQINNPRVLIKINNDYILADEKGVFTLNLNSITDIEYIEAPSGMNFVASRKGKKYYKVNSPAAQKLKPANRIYFRTEDEAIQAGYY